MAGYKEKKWLNQMAREGWEHVTQFAGWQYFRAIKNDDTVPDIFSDKDSEVEKYNGLLRILTWRFESIII